MEHQVQFQVQDILQVVDQEHQDQEVHHKDLPQVEVVEHTLLVQPIQVAVVDLILEEQEQLEALV